MFHNNKANKSSPSDKKRLLENFLSLGIIQVISYVIPLISLPYLSRVLGVENFGRVFFAYAFIQYFVIITDFGFGLSAVKDIAQASDDKEKCNRIFNSVIGAKFILIIISFIILTAIIILIPKFRQDYLIYLFTFLMVIGNALFPIWFFQGIQHMKYITFINVTSKVIFLILLFTLIKDSEQYVYVPLLNSFGFIVSAALGILIAVKRFKIRLFIPNFKEILSQLKSSADFFLSRVSASIFTNTNAFFLGLVSSPIMVGYYVASEKIYDAIDTLFAQVNNVLYPYMSKNKNIIFYKKILVLSIAITIGLSLFCLIFSKDIILIFYGNEMSLAYKIFQIFVIILLIKIPATMIGYPLLAAFEKTKETNYSVIVSAICHIIGLFILLYFNKINVYSIAIMVGISVFIMLLIRLIFVIKYKLLKVKM